MKEYRTKDLYADFYENGDRNKPLLVVIGGSIAGIPTISKDLREYFEANFHVLVLAYFGVGDLPKNLQRIPLEYFIHAVEYFKDTLQLTDEQVFMIGSSKGGELVLLLISGYIHPRAAIACVPSCYVWQGIPDGMRSILFSRSSWTFDGKDIPFVKFRYNQKIIKDLQNKVYLSCHEKSIQQNKNNEALIQVNNYQGQLLLLSAETDHFWPSKEMCNLMKQNGGNDIKHVTLNLEGHYFLQYEQSSKEIMAFLNHQKS
jgi:BAAT / Acyl-CoA thioester hydrolase C terminal.